MHQDNGSISQMLVLCDCLHDGRYPVIFPIQAVNIPLDGVIAHLTRRRDDLIVIVAIRRTEQKHIIAGDLFDLVMHLLQFRFTFFHRQL